MTSEAEEEKLDTRSALRKWLAAESKSKQVNHAEAIKRQCEQSLLSQIDSQLKAICVQSRSHVPIRAKWTEPARAYLVYDVARDLRLHWIPSLKKLGVYMSIDVEPDSTTDPTVCLFHIKVVMYISIG